MNRRNFLGVAAATGLPCLNPAGAAGTRNPNIVLIAADRWRAQTLPSAGDRDVDAPNLERLAAEGVHFNRVYAARPSIDASRAALLAGRWPHAVRPDEGGFARTLTAAGYQTKADLPVAEAVDFVRQGKSSPFFLSLNWKLPTGHRRAERFHLRENVPEKLYTRTMGELGDYYGACTVLDRDAGAILRALEKANLADDTILVFTSACGEMLGSQGLDGADVPFEESARVPLLVRYRRKLAKGKSSDLLLSNADVLPTVLVLAGVEIPDGTQGRDLSGQLLTGEGDSPESVYAYGKIGTPDEWRMIVRGVDKMVMNKQGIATHLYNLGQDPFETTNLSEDVARNRKLDELKAFLLAWRKRVGDGMDPSGLKTRGPKKRKS